MEELSKDDLINKWKTEINYYLNYHFVQNINLILKQNLLGIRLNY